MFRTLSLVALIAVGAQPVAAEVVIKAGHGTTSEHPTHLALMRFADSVAEATNGEVTVEAYPDRQLGEERELAEGLQLGTVDMAVISTGPLLSFAPGIGVVDLPFLFRDSKHVETVLDGEIGTALLAEFDGTGIKGLGWWENGWRHLTANEPIRAVEDLDGLKLRTMQNPVHIAAFEKLGAAPIPMAWGEVFTSLGQGVIDAQENPITITYVNSLWEVQDYLMLTGHVFGPHVVLMSQSKWDSLTPEQQTIVTDALTEATAFQRSEATRLEAENLEKLKENGMEVIEVDTAPFREAVRDIAASQSELDQDMIEQIKAIGE
ncbi:DctP family TRAP transporter solute-binding subunit [Paracoccus sp. S-4012]|uniref:TRAP transporter substrate-binding protein n=1 Tax=Paracoccus sp. S-4012 TaxID=2665648 RepID=UPI0012B11FF4|nr:TRAP transporter substrate-binding protein [Paracoccus sp. S-4012]MRX52086.1 DctP family TRAP transporter solute-binding subunit [Paracoccus sp. S-4012]